MHFYAQNPGVLLRESIAIFAEKTRGFAKMQIKTTKLQEISQLLGVLRVLRIQKNVLIFE